MPCCCPEMRRVKHEAYHIGFGVGCSCSALHGCMHMQAALAVTAHMLSWRWSEDAKASVHSAVSDNVILQYTVYNDTLSDEWHYHEAAAISDQIAAHIAAR